MTAILWLLAALTPSAAALAAIWLGLTTIDNDEPDPETPDIEHSVARRTGYHEVPATEMYEGVQ